MNTVAIVQARMGSTRLPNKVMRHVCGRPMIGLLLERLARAKRVDRIVLATTDNAADDALAAHVAGLGYSVFRGSEHDVLARYHGAAVQARAEIVVRVTGDCPLIDPDVVDAVLHAREAAGAGYASNIVPPTFPDGLDTEAFTFAALDDAQQNATEPQDREHVTFRIERDATKAYYTNDVDHSLERWTVDEPEDFAVVEKVFEHFHPRTDFSWHEVIDLRAKRPEIFAANRHFIRNEGATQGSGQKLWKRAKRVIPGGNMLLSKRAEMFLPDLWPAYFSRAKGCRVWDLDGRELIDMSLMGIGTNLLGYGHPEVDAAVHRTVDAGNMSTLNCPEEVALAERLVALHPWADMARLARTGGEANAVAIRIARAAAGKDKVAFCGYHGWHDWYLAANLQDDASLNGHLLPGLAPNGVPSSLNHTVLPFDYNRLDQLEALVSAHDVGVICMEVSRNRGPEPGFLEGVRSLATKRGIVLMFDECTSGFRQSFGGLHLQYGVEPDMAMFGKALGNGYAITAVIGRRGVMEAAQTSFISSTFWTERIGPTAALATLDVMERTRSWETVTATGRSIGERWVALAAAYSLPIEVSGLPALIGFNFELPDARKYKTLLTQEMLKRGFLASNSVYVSLAHTPVEIDAYFVALEEVFGMMRTCLQGSPIDALLDGPVCHEGFKRLN